MSDEDVAAFTRFLRKLKRQGKAGAGDPFPEDLAAAIEAAIAAEEKKLGRKLTQAERQQLLRDE